MNARRHFHSFDALRFFAFFKVFLLHLPITAFPVFNFIKNGGGTGVLFFFVLSGFLITYILLVEKKQRDTISLKRFFARRILRIWPLYYLMVLFAFLTPYLLSLMHLSSSAEGYTPNWLMSLLFLENYQMILTGNHPNVSPLGVTWSLCIEEHFYVLWGLLLYITSIRKLPFVFAGCFAIALVSRYFFLQNDIPTIDLLTNIDFFVYGAIPAYLLVEHQNRIKQLGNLSFKIKMVIVLVTIICVLLFPNIAYGLQAQVEPVILGCLFAVLILLILPEKNAIRIGDRNVFSRLGLYTYGLYLLHTIVINFLVQVFNSRGLSLDSAMNAMLFFLLSLALTILAGMASYHFFERQFLRLKDRYGGRGAETATAFASAESSRDKDEGKKYP